LAEQVPKDLARLGRLILGLLGRRSSAQEGAE
jgi:hypothetical protein